MTSSLMNDARNNTTSPDVGKEHFFCLYPQLEPAEQRNNAFCPDSCIYTCKQPVKLLIVQYATRIMVTCHTLKIFFLVGTRCQDYLNVYEVCDTYMVYFGKLLVPQYCVTLPVSVRCY